MEDTEEAAVEEASEDTAALDELLAAEVALLAAVEEVVPGWQSKLTELMPNPHEELPAC